MTLLQILLIAFLLGMVLGATVFSTWIMVIALWVTAMAGFLLGAMFVAGVREGTDP